MYYYDEPPAYETKECPECGMHSIPYFGTIFHWCSDCNHKFYSIDPDDFIQD